MKCMFAAVAVVALTGVSHSADFGADRVGLPPLPADRQDVYEYYRLSFMDDGYPGKQTDSGVVAHPIYGAYVVYDYLRLFRETGEQRYLDAAVKVANASIANMEPVGDTNTLAFYYEPESGLSYYPGRFYSGLTQARYLTPLRHLAEATGDARYLEAAHKIFESLAVPKKKGGVQIETSYGPAIEEYPHDIPTYVLNGWTTIVLELLNYGRAANDKDATKIAIANMETIASVLPKYDVPDLSLSRYQLTGFVYFKFVFDKPNACRVDKLQTVVDGQKYGMSDSGTRWTNHVVRNEHRTIQINAVLSQIDDAQGMETTLDCNAASDFDLYVSNGDYDPKLSGMPTHRWLLLQEGHVEPGRNDIRGSYDNTNFPMLGYPTNFAKEIGGKSLNVYHWMHITNLMQISEIVPNKAFDHYAKKWLGYTEGWSQIPALSGLDFDCISPSCQNISAHD